MESMHKVKCEPRIQEELDRINNIKETRYLTRSELMEMIRFPQNSLNLVVIKSNDKGIGFLKTMYDSRYCAGLINKDEFDNVIEKASNLMGNVYSKKRKMDSQGVPFWYKLALVLACLTAFPFLIMAYYLPENDLWYEILTFVLLAVSLVIVCAISLVNFCKKTDEIKTYEEMIYERIGAYFKKINDSEYSQRGLEWFLVPGHYWLELRIKKRRNNFVSSNGDNPIPTQQDTLENRGGKSPNKREELKTEEPVFKDSSDDRRNLDDLSS
jgi:hypothetical protein